MERVALKPARADDAWLSERGVWRGARPPDGPRTAMMSCPDCGFVASLRDHAIDEAGNVSPSVVCPHSDCAFHSHVFLVDWAER